MNENQPDANPPFLHGIAVVEFGDGIAGASAAATLASLGATVSAVRAGASLLNRRAPTVTADEGGPRSLLGVVLDRDKIVLAQDSTDLDAVITLVDRCEGAGPVATMPTSAYLDHVAATNRAVWVTISPFGLDGPRRNWHGTELTMAATGGLLATVTDPANKRPLKLAGNQALLSVGAVAALAACHGLDEYTRTGRPVHVDVSAQEAIIATGPVLQVSLRMLNCPGVAGARRYGAPAGYYRCRDGLVRISVMEDHQWQALLRALDHPDWARGLVTSEDRKAHDELIDEHVTAALATWTKADCEQRLQAEGVPVAAMYTASDLAQAPHLGDRGAYREQTVGTTTIRTVGLPFRYRPSAKPRSVRAGLTGLRVTEVGHVLAAPLASALLGAMGADVTKLEDPERLDMYRRRGPYVDGIESPDHSAYFAVVNHSKSSIVMAMTREPDRLADHLSKVDVLIENLGQSRARRLNIDSATLAQSHPDVLAVSSSGFGYTGRWSAFRAYAYNLHTAGGLAYLTRGSNGEPAELDLAWADLISGYALATIIAAWAVGKDTQYGAAIDFSMFDLVVQRFNEFIAAAFGGVADGEDLDASNHLRPFAPHAVYPAAGDRWLAIAVDGDPQWLALRAALGRPPELFRDEFSTAAHRDVHQDELDLILKSLISTRNAFDLERKLQSAGVAANVVLDADDLLTDTHLAARAFYPSVTHPVWGQRNLVGLPWRFVGGMPVILGPPPQLRLTPSKQPAPT